MDDTVFEGQGGFSGGEAYGQASARKKRCLEAVPFVFVRCGSDEVDCVLVAPESNLQEFTDGALPYIYQQLLCKHIQE